MSTTYTLSGYSYLLDASGPLPDVSGITAAHLAITGSAGLELVLTPAGENDQYGLEVAAGALDGITLDGAALDLEGGQYALFVEAFARGGVPSQIAVLLDFESANAADMTLRAYTFTLSGVGLTNAAVPSEAALLQSLNALPSIDPSLGAIQPGAPFAVADLPGVAVTETVAGDFLSGGDGPDSLVGGDGDDALLGRDGDDVLEGGPGDDTIAGSTGNDTVSGGDDADSIGGGPGDDVLNGQGGNDEIGGGLDNDVVSGGGGADWLSGGAGDDTLSGGAGADRIGGSFGNDSVEGGDDNDALGGGAGQDTLRGGAGRDSLGGGEGRDLVLGGDGADFVAGGGNDDTLRGGSGNDTLNGGTGADRLSGEAGADLFVFNGGDAGAVDTITDFTQGADLIRLSGVAGGFGGLAIAAGNGSAVIAYDGQDIVLEGVTAGSLTAEDFVFV